MNCSIDYSMAKTLHALNSSLSVATDSAINLATSGKFKRLSGSDCVTVITLLISVAISAWPDFVAKLRIS
jgi:hypothetical protein